MPLALNQALLNSSLEQVEVGLDHLPTKRQLQLVDDSIVVHVVPVDPTVDFPTLIAELSSESKMLLPIRVDDEPSE